MSSFVGTTVAVAAADVFKIGIVGTSGNYGNIFKIRNCDTYFSESWELMKKIGIVGTYQYLKIRNCGNLF
jgi:hypothetical protein